MLYLFVERFLNTCCDCFCYCDSGLAWWVMHDWLQNFAYRINISWMVFVVAGFIAVAIALFTISFQAIKAAIANPVKSLRTE